MDRYVIKRFRAGDEKAFNLLYDRYARRVFSFTRTLSGSAEDAEDLTQETFVAAFRSRSAFRTSDALLPWLLGIAVRRHRDSRRHRRFSTAHIDYDEARHYVDLGSERLCDKVVAGVALESALQQLSWTTRAAFLLVASQGLTHHEAACALRCPLGTLKWRVADAVRTMRARLSADWEEEKLNV